jgi:hypothetical protein
LHGNLLSRKDSFPPPGAAGKRSEAVGNWLYGVAYRAARRARAAARRGKNKSIYRPGPHLHCLNATPVAPGEHLYGVGNIGDLMCVKAETGE